MSSFEQWHCDNEELLSSHNVPKYIAEIIWDSAKVSALHDVAAAIQDGSIKVSVSL